MPQPASKDPNVARAIRAPRNSRPLSERQVAFAKALHEGVEPGKAYRDTVMQPTSKPLTDYEATTRAKLLAYRPLMLAELARLQASAPKEHLSRLIPGLGTLVPTSVRRKAAQDSLYALPIPVVPDQPVVNPQAVGRPELQETIMPVAQPVQFLPNVDKTVRYSPEWFVAMLDINAARAMQAVPVRDSQGNPTGEWTYAGSVANKALELMAKIKGVLVDRKDITLRTVEKLPDDEIARRRQEIRAQLAALRGEATDIESREVG